MIAAALSAHSPVRPELLVDALNIVNQGTSMACPFVAGLVALLLERDPDLEPAALADLLRSHSSVPGRPPGTFDPKWGYGLISAEGL
jgi:subtilisin family serine protease